MMRLTPFGRRPMVTLACIACLTAALAACTPRNGLDRKLSDNKESWATALSELTPEQNGHAKNLLKIIFQRVALASSIDPTHPVNARFLKEFEKKSGTLRELLTWTIEEETRKSSESLSAALKLPALVALRDVRFHLVPGEAASNNWEMRISGKVVNQSPRSLRPAVLSLESEVPTGAARLNCSAELTHTPELRQADIPPGGAVSFSNLACASRHNNEKLGRDNALQVFDSIAGMDYRWHRLGASLEATASQPYANVEYSEATIRQQLEDIEQLQQARRVLGL